MRTECGAYGQVSAQSIKAQRNLDTFSGILVDFRLNNEIHMRVYFQRALEYFSVPLDLHKTLRSAFLSSNCIGSKGLA